MDYQTTAAASTRMHPLMMAAASSVVLVSLLGVAAITGLIPSSHGSAVSASGPTVGEWAIPATPTTATRYVTPDGQVLEVVRTSQQVLPVRKPVATQVEHVYEPAPVVHRKVVHHYAQNTYSQPAGPVRTYEQPQPSYVPQQHPIQNYVSDMHPVGTGVGAVVGGLLGNQVGKSVV